MIAVFIEPAPTTLVVVEVMDAVKYGQQQQQLPQLELCSTIS